MNQAIVRPSLIPRPTWLWRAVLLFVGIWLAVSTIIPPALGAQDTAWTFKPLPDNVSYLDNLYFIDDQTGWAVGGADDPVGAVILKTMNAGDDWTTQLTVPGYEIVSLHFADVNNGYAVGGKAYKTTNGGADWVEHTVHDEVGETLHDVSCISATTAVAVGKDHTQNQALIYRTTDGASWTQANYPAIVSSQLNAVTFVDTAHGWAVGKKDSSSRPLILYTSDGGANWAEQPNPATVGELQRVFFLDALNGWAVGGTGDGAGDSVVFLQTADGGTTWTVGDEPPGTLARSVHMVSASEGYVMVNENASGGSWSATLYHTEDGGGTWAEALAVVAGGYFSNVQIVSSSGSLARRAADRPATLLQTTQQSRTAFGAGSRNDESAFGSASLDGDPSPQLSRIDITPSYPSTIHVGETILFTAKGYDQNGDEVPITPIWSASGGTITQGGEYTADTVGDFIVTASVEDSPVQGTASVHVDPAPILKHIDITPSYPSTIHVGETILFTAKGYDQNGDEVPITPIWSASGGRLTSGGLRFSAPLTGTQSILYVAGNLPGRYSVVAAQDEVEGRAWVTILGAAPPDLAPGQSWEHTFSTAGVYPYCNSRDFNLRGTLIVSPTVGRLHGLDAKTVISVSITATGFEPLTVTLGVSDTVRWVNADVVAHAIRGGEPYQVYLPLVVRS